MPKASWRRINWLCSLHNEFQVLLNEPHLSHRKSPLWDDAGELKLGKHLSDRKIVWCHFITFLHLIFSTTDLVLSKYMRYEFILAWRDLFKWKCSSKYIKSVCRKIVEFRDKLTWCYNRKLLCVCAL